MRLGTFICDVTTPNVEFVGLVFGAAKVTWLKTFNASMRNSIRNPSRTCTCFSSAASEELYAALRILAKVGESVTRLLASCCAEFRLNTAVLNHCDALLWLLDNAISFALTVRSTLPKLIGVPL